MNTPNTHPIEHPQERIEIIAGQTYNAPPLQEPIDWESYKNPTQDTQTLYLPADADLNLIANHLHKINTVYILFSHFSDGRGFSLTRQLRQTYGYKKTIIAWGNVLIDQYVFALQCGFDAVQISSQHAKRRTTQQWKDTLGAFDLTYQRGFVFANGPAIAISEARTKVQHPTLSQQYIGLSAQKALTRALHEDFRGEIALVSSMGIDSAILLHMIANIDAHTPVLFLDTHKHFAQTIAYRDMLIEHFSLKNVQTLSPDTADIQACDPQGNLHLSNKDACCALRKVRPLASALGEYKAHITGRKRYQTPERANLTLWEESATQTKINPLYNWHAKDITFYMRQHNLPVHPLLSQGYWSIGCAPCTHISTQDTPRQGRWQEDEKTECGIHFIDGKWIKQSQN